MTAECLNEQVPSWFRHRQEAPGVRCSCGLYAQGPDRPITDWTYVLNGRVKASGSILMWGRIIQCEAGYKAQHARIESPIVLDATCRGAAGKLQALEKNCVEPVARIEISDLLAQQIWAYCEWHAGRTWTIPPALVDAGVWFDQACRNLSEIYQVEVHSYI
jgi:hypothetical protein